MKLVLTCEHAGNRVPEKFSSVFNKADEILETHRGYDPGALDLFKELKKLSDFCHFQMVSRLLIESNRSLHHKQLFSEYSRELPSETKTELVETIYLPYRNEVEEFIFAAIKQGEEVLHLSIHSFTPVMDGQERNADIGLLYDPSRKEEKLICAALRRELLRIKPELKIRFNYPYMGKADGFTTWLRKKFPKHYLGIELEVNQKFVTENKMEDKQKQAILVALEMILKEGKQEDLKGTGKY